jgi:hypothetical protein
LSGLRDYRPDEVVDNHAIAARTALDLRPDVVAGSGHRDQWQYECGDSSRLALSRLPDSGEVGSGDADVIATLEGLRV